MMKRNVSERGRKILVLGCGALGGTLIDRFSPCADVTVVDPSPRVSVKKHIFHSVDGIKGRSFDGLIVATKCYDLDKSLIPLRKSVFIKRILFLQNGILNLARVPQLFPKAAIVRGVTTSAFGISSRRAFFYYQGEFFLAPYDDKMNEAVSWFGRLLADAGFKTSIVSTSSRIVWAKLIFSAVMNPLPVMTGQRYDVLKKDQEIWKLVKQAVNEGRAVAKALRVRLAFDPLRLIDRVRNGDLAGIKHRGSIIQDIKVGCSTELDFITGALIRHARKVGVKTPALDLILLRAKEAGA